MKPGLWFAGLGVLVFVVIQVLTHLPLDWFDKEGFLEWFDGREAWGYLLFVLGFVFLAMFPLPSTLWVLLGGSLFGTLIGSLLSLFAATLAAVLAFVVGRNLGQSYVQRHASGWLRRILHGVEVEGWRFVALTRLIPVFPFAPTNYAFGVTRIPLGVYSLTTLIGLIPNLVAYSWLGSAAHRALTEAESWVEWGLLLLAFFALLVFLPRFIRNVVGQRATADDNVNTLSAEQSPDSEVEEESSSGIRS